MTDTTLTERVVAYYRYGFGWEGNPSREEILLREYIEEYLELGPRRLLIRNLAILGIAPNEFERLMKGETL